MRTRATLLALLVASCGASDSTPSGTVDAPTDDVTSTDAPPGDGAAPAGDSSAPALPEGPFLTPEGCNALAPEWSCLLPFPSDAFLQPDPSMPTGRRVEVPDAAVPRDLDDVAPDFEGVTPVDGFSVLPQIGVLIPGGIDDGPLVFHTEDLSLSMEWSSPTLLIDAETGERVMHFAELDPRTSPDVGAFLIIRPLVRLKDAHRYVVALHDLTTPGGSAVEPPAAFRALRDATPDLKLAELAQVYEARVFPVITGVPRGELQLAWELTTASPDVVTRDMMAVRADALERMATTAPAVQVSAVTDDVDSHIARRIEGTLTVPLYLGDAKPGATLHRGPDGLPAANGIVAVPFTLLVPRSAWDSGTPARFLQFGHGFFGGRGEIDGEFVRTFADRTGVVVAAVDWWGMSKDDLPVVLEKMVLDVSRSLGFTERLHQAMVNQLALAHALPAIAALPELQGAGGPLLDPGHVYFYGISQGHILGAIYVTLSPHVERATFAVGGAGFGLMMSRANPFLAFMALIDARFGNDPVKTLQIQLLMQTTFDRIDPITYTPRLLSDTLPGCPASRRVLQHIGIGDTSVPNLASHVFARALGLPSIAPAPRPIAGLSTKAPPIDGSAVAEYDFGVPIPDIVARPVQTKNEVHEGQRALPASMDQIDAFLREGGTIQSFCDGVCDPE
ncbi:MAG: hypothetical protein AMXMBFR64_26270 [Myxococcales bacterium]